MAARKKKSTRKKATKKKAAKKKATAAHAGPSPKKFKALEGHTEDFWCVPGSLGEIVYANDAKGMVVVRFNNYGGLNNPHARKTENDRVWIRNEGSKKRRLTPHRPVFLPHATIVVPPYSVVGPFTLDPAAPIGHVKLLPDPANDQPPPGQGPPGDPGFDTDG